MRITVKLKLALAFAVVIVLSGVTAWLGVSNLAALNDTMQTVVTVDVGRMRVAQELRPDLLTVVNAQNNLLLASTNGEQRVRNDAELAKQSEAFGQRIDKLVAMASVEGKKRLGLLTATRQRWLELLDKIRKLVADNQLAEAIGLSTGTGHQLVIEQEKEIADYMALFEIAFTRANDGAAQQYASARVLLIAAAVVALLAGVVAAFLIAFSISRGLRKAISLANAVAIGDLNQQVVVKSNDEIKDMVQALSQMTANLRATALVADAIGGGDFTMEAKRLSDKDTLGISLERMTNNLRGTAKSPMRSPTATCRPRSNACPKRTPWASLWNV